MARIRTIKPEFWEDEKLADIPLQARLLFIGTWNFADDFGVLIASAKFLKSKVFPYEESLREHQVNTWLDALVNARMLIPFVYEGKSYYKIRTFNSHQLIDKRYTKSILPEGVSASELLAGLDLQQNTTLTHSDHQVFTRSKSKSKGSVKGKGEEVDKEEVCPNIFLSEGEIEKLKKDYGEEMYSDAIQFLSDYSKEKPDNFKKYKDHNLTIRRWVIDAVKEKKEKSSVKKENKHGNTATISGPKAEFGSL